MMKKTLFLTGFPGFLTSSLVQQLYEDYTKEINHIYLLVLLSEEKTAYKKLARLEQENKLPRDKCTIIAGDITRVNIGINRDIQRKIADEITHVYHLAAIYDLAVPEPIAKHVNVHGTRKVNEWVQTLSNLRRYTYFSTAYVSGNREGHIYEEELNMNQTFRNYYEQTKYEAEVYVDQLKTDVPITIIRPGIVKGDSKTGETMKFDGLYFMLNMYDKLSFLPFIPYIEEGLHSPEGNFVSIDYVLQASSYLSMNVVGEGKTYHLTDPNPYTMRELQKMIATYYLGKTPKGKLPASLMKGFLQSSTIQKWFRTEVEAIDYFTVYSSYDTSIINKDLKGTGIYHTDLAKTIVPMIDFYRKYKDDKIKHIEIS